jgi:hypothetical protein
MRVWLDDIRPMPSKFDVHCKTAVEAINLLKTGKVTFISFDHDLADPGVKEMTGYTVARWIEEAAFDKRMTRIGFAVHSANPVGIFKIREAMEQAQAFWTEYEEGRW